MVERENIRHRIGQIRADLHDTKERRRAAHRTLNDLNKRVAQLLEEEESLNKMLAAPSNQ
jgi:chromosome segregation ATPase|tara:strand:+ start:3916 stop:4095 length:180 start_codon:yes stop_codon:yes gene_type:complete